MSIDRVSKHLLKINNKDGIEASRRFRRLILDV